MTDTDTNRKKVAVGMSGGVDSSVAAFLLQQQGYDVIGLTMQIWDGNAAITGERSGCYGPGEAEDIAAAREVAESLGIPLFTISLVEEYKREVLDYFRREYLAGRTPNPCVRCNHQVKFGFLLDKARRQGVEFDCFATGHYARVEYVDASGRFILRRAADEAKDQSYFLAQLSQAQLSRLIFPLGEMRKEQVKEIARAHGWPALADKPESQDFVECKDYSVLFKPEEAVPGLIMDDRGQVVGEHRGLIHYTVGQRRGLGIGGSASALYVLDLDSQHNTLKVGSRDELLSKSFKADGLNWISLAAAPAEPLQVKAKIRQKHPPAAACLTADGPDSVAVTFTEPQSSITPGQTAVFYEEDRVIGSGIIKNKDNK